MCLLFITVNLGRQAVAMLLYNQHFHGSIVQVVVKKQKQNVFTLNIRTVSQI